MGQQPHGAPFEHCISVGPSCHAAAFLRAHPAGLRAFSLPFDWLHSDCGARSTWLPRALWTLHGCEPCDCERCDCERCDCERM